MCPPPSRRHAPSLSPRLPLGSPAAVARARPGMAGLGLRCPTQASVAFPTRARAPAAATAATPRFGSPRRVDMAPEGAGPHRAPRPSPRRPAPPSPHRSPEASPASQPRLRVALVAEAAEGSPGRGVCDGAGVG